MSESVHQDNKVDPVSSL